MTQPARPPAGRRRAALALVVLAGLIAVGYLAAALFFGGGVFCFPLDDGYIYAQYARQALQGEWFRYNSGEAPTTGATSLLYGLLTTLLYALGARGDGIALALFAVGFGFLAWSALLFRRLLELCGLPPWLALAGAVLLLLAGPVTWGYFSGMEVPLYTALLLWTAVAFLAENPSGRFRITPLAACLLALARPEAGAALVVLAVCVLVQRRHRRLGSAWLAAPFALVVGWLLLNRALTGLWAPTSGLPKAYLWGTGNFRLLDRGVEFLIGLWKGLYGGAYSSRAVIEQSGDQPQRYFPPGLLALALAGVIGLAASRRRSRAPAAILAGIFVAGNLAAAATTASGFQNFRYIVPFFPFLLALALIGVYFAGGWAQRVLGLRGTWVAGLLAAYLGAFFALGGKVFLTDYGVRCNLQRTLLRDMGLWMRARLPASARVMLIDAGATRYYGEHPVVDLLGLVSRPFSGIYWRGEGVLFEQLEHEAAPPEFALFQEVTLDALPPVRRLVEGLDASPVHRRSWGGGTASVVYRLDTRIFDSGALPLDGPADVPVDVLDVGDLASEAAHGYRFRSGAPPTTFFQAPLASRGGVADGGRVVGGGERFVLRARPGRSAVLALRTAAGVDATWYTYNGPQAFQAAADPDTPLMVRVNGGEWASFPVPYRPEGWTEVAVPLTANVVKNTMRIEVRGLRTSFHYWLYQ